MLAAATINYIRSIIGDTDTSNLIFTDIQIDAVYTKFPNDNLTIAKLLRALAARAAQQKSTSIGKISESTDPQSLLDQAIEYEALAAAEGFDTTGGTIAYDEVIDIAHSEFSMEEILVNKILNNGFIV